MLPNKNKYFNLIFKRGSEVIVTARRKDRLETLAQEIEKTGGKAHIFVEDLSMPESGKKLYDQIKSAGLNLSRCDTACSTCNTLACLTFSSICSRILLMPTYESR